MSGMDESLRPQKSRITIYDEPVICSFCSHDVYIPHEVIVNVEQPGVGVRHVRYTAICQYCGQAKHFGDPSHYDTEKEDYIWALNQYLISVRSYKIKIVFYVGKKSNDKITSFTNKLIQDFGIEVDNIKTSNLKGVGELQIKISSLNEIQNIRSHIMNSARRLYITLKDLTIK
ncbi:hypothetical protein [Psychrobacillus sp. OK032]|uniref:hypothetical protein n=1 Tax=Psychrobacillus sp. OK032 TaxID=1884358 RepID=UPI0008B6795A|nr:hypothetical protein [Psychrobacillus sp. OK032]SES45498.1 hypothetical protein SAMN05518872_1198 [Psychrobacillus sp. OK032]